jgi:hypothetical protein
MTWIKFKAAKTILRCAAVFVAHFVCAVGLAVLSQILLEFECGHRPDIIMLRAPQTAETR